MSQRWEFETKDDFLAKIEELLRSGVPAAQIETLTPVPVEEAEGLLRERPSRLRFFTLAGGLLGMATGLAFPIFTVVSWPLITAGKPLVSIPPFVIISFELTILFGALLSFTGFLLLARMPSARRILRPEEHDNRFVVIYHGGESA